MASIDIKDKLEYVSLDSAIEQLIALRETYGGDSIIDVGMEPVPYEDAEHVVINLIIKE